MRTSSGSRFRWLPLIPSRGYAFKPVKDHHEEWDESHPRFSLSKDNPLSSGVDMFGTVWSRIMNGSKNWRCHTLLIFHQGQSLQNTSFCLLPSYQFPQTQNDKIKIRLVMFNNAAITSCAEHSCAVLSCAALARACVNDWVP